MENSIEYGQMLREMRIRAGLTQEELAHELNRTKSCVSKYERGWKLPDIETFRNWVRITKESRYAVVQLFGAELIMQISNFTSTGFMFMLHAIC